MDRQIARLISFFHEDMPTACELREIRNQPDDHRWVLFVTFPEGRYVIKAAANGFTTRERVEAWPELIAEYAKLGYYSPALRKSRRECYAHETDFRDIDCLVWEEEFAPFPLADQVDQALVRRGDGRRSFHEDALTMVARVAGLHLSGFPGKSGYVRLSPFTADEKTDEVTECVENMENLVRGLAPAHFLQWQEIRALWEDNRQKLEAIYPHLPTSVFQADWGDNNTLVDETGRFRGMIDFNLAGEDTALNIFLSMILYGFSSHRTSCNDPDELPRHNEIVQNSVIDITLQTLRFLQKSYTFTAAEAEAAPYLFKYISAVEYSHQNALREFAADSDKLNRLFAFMEHQLIRDDIDFAGAMMG